MIVDPYDSHVFPNRSNITNLFIIMFTKTANCSCQTSAYSINTKMPYYSLINSNNLLCLPPCTCAKWKERRSEMNDINAIDYLMLMLNQKYDTVVLAMNI